MNAVRIRQHVLVATALLALAGCGGDDDAQVASTSSSSTVTTAPAAERLTAETYTALADGRAALGGTTRECAATSFGAAGRCVANQFVPILKRVIAYQAALTGARASVTGPCADSLDRSITFQNQQAARVRGIIAQGRKVRDEAGFNRLNQLLTANGDAATANDAQRTANPDQDWATACQPGA